MSRSVLLAAGLVLLLAAGASAAVPPFDTSRLYTEAAFAASIAPYTDAIARNAGDAEAHYWLGVAYLHGARLFKFGLAPFAEAFAPRAVASLERAMQLRPAMATLLALIDAYGMAGDLDKFFAAVDRAIALAPPIPLK